MIDIRKMDSEELSDFIYSRLQFNPHQLQEMHNANVEPHRRFDMSGYGRDGSCVLHNQAILNLFADCGIYDHVDYLFVDAYKGGITVYYALFSTGAPLQENMMGLGTTGIIRWILDNLVLADGLPKRRTE